MSDDVDYGSLNILVVEDETHTRTMIKAMLRNIGVRLISEAANGRDGLIEVVNVRPNLVFCDIHMKPIDGREFLKTLRGMTAEGVQDTPVVFLTADAQRDTVAFAMDHAIDGYLVKPTSPGAIKSRIDTVMKARRRK